MVISVVVIAAVALYSRASRNGEAVIRAVQAASVDPAHTIAQLTAVTAETPTAAAWSDLAAALLARSEQLDDGNLIVDALAATDRALALDPRLPQARFTRAVVLERLGLVRDARRQWVEYLRVEHSDEAWQHLHSLKPANPADASRRSFAALRNAARPDDAAIGELVRKYPQYVRRASEGEVMADWATATLKDDAIAAARHLEFARLAGRHLSTRSGENLLRDSVAAVDHAAAAGNADVLAGAYVLYREARLLYQADQALVPEEKLRRAVALFERGTSPMAYVVRYYIGSVLHAQSRLAEATAVLEALENERLDRRGYPAAAAQFGWERGLCLLEQGSISEAIDIFTRSREALARLGEIETAAAMDGFVANALDFAGDSAGAWRARRRALQTLTRAGDEHRAYVILQSAATSATLARQWSRARALLDLTVAGATRRKNAVVAAHACAQRAVVRGYEGDAPGARSDIDATRRWLAQLNDPSIRMRAEADLAFAEAMLLKDTDPQRALAQLDETARFYERAGRRAETPRIYLERARVAKRIGRVEEARRDVDAGIAIVARERAALRDLEQRASLLAAADELFDDAIALAMESRDPESAFRLSEARRARMLTDLFELGPNAVHSEVAPMQLAEIRESLAHDAAIVAYAALPDRLITFAVRREGIVAETTNVSRDTVATSIAALSEAIRGNTAEVLGKSAAADTLLLHPVREALAGARYVAFITDRHTSGVPFGALYDQAARRFLIENAVITTAPSATLLMAASRHVTRSKLESLLAIGASTFDYETHPRLAALPHAAAEAEEIARMYREATLVSGREATTSVAKMFGNYAVIHFAGHALPRRDRVGESALLFAPSSVDDGELRLQNIARLPMHGTRLVILAACRSATEVARGDGAENLALGFIAAGVPSVVASIWDIEDRVSRILMTEFHRRVREGDSPARAIQAVANERLRDASGRIQTPLDWAGIVAVGGSPELVDRERRGARR